MSELASHARDALAFEVLGGQEVCAGALELFVAHRLAAQPLDLFQHAGDRVASPGRIALEVHAEQSRVERRVAEGRDEDKEGDLDHDEGKVDEGLMLEFLQSHAAVINQPGFDSPYYSGLNPYALGFAIFMDIKRICDAPTAEDREWFPDIAGSPWRETLEFAMRNFKDESFIQQFLSPKVIRDLKLFLIVDDDQVEMLEVAAIHDDRGYKRIREALSSQYALSVREPNIQVVEAAIRGDRSLTLHHIQDSRRPLGRSVYPVIRHLQQLWGFPVHLVSMEDGKVTRRYHWPVEEESKGAG